MQDNANQLLTFRDVPSIHQIVNVRHVNMATYSIRDDAFLTQIKLKIAVQPMQVMVRASNAVMDCIPWIHFVIVMRSLAVF